ncbi:MAG: hypothetical protein OEX18_13870 [Candidatus Krumholzibacteria bacterium]|nr:hypothetical protein [Candidatus Krumholzibacteria bacterium]MDH4338355.1 hypothetical protein [Candidatus Krumholzibacteria bacterium]MDH5269805.1 hypothetical protein [Candidatus Krumholzibacteria bacterium]
MSEARTVSTPRHLWIIGIVGLLWNIMGVVDYLMTQTRNETYMAKFSAEELEYFYGLPAWVVSTWALAVWGGLLGTVLLLMRRKLAVHVFLVSLLCVVVTAIQNYGLSEGMEIMGATGMIFTVVIFAIALGLYLYAKKMARRGVLV